MTEAPGSDGGGADAATPDVAVRAARVEDVGSVARVQIDVWRTAYSTILPRSVLDSLSLDAAAATWDAAIRQPPSQAHRLLVATEGPLVVGMAAVGVSGDTDLPAAAELLALYVHPNWPRHGHGSRLLAACVDGWRADGRVDAIAWTFEADKTMQNFLEGAGFGFDGITRSVEGPDGELQQVRLRTAL